MIREIHGCARVRMAIFHFIKKTTYGARFVGGDSYKKKHDCQEGDWMQSLNALLVKHWKRHSMVNHMK